MYSLSGGKTEAAEVSVPPHGFGCADEFGCAVSGSAGTEAQDSKRNESPWLCSGTWQPRSAAFQRRSERHRATQFHRRTHGLLLRETERAEGRAIFFVQTSASVCVLLACTARRSVKLFTELAASQANDPSKFDQIWRASCEKAWQWWTGAGWHHEGSWGRRGGLYQRRLLIGRTERLSQSCTQHLCLI